VVATAAPDLETAPSDLSRGAPTTTIDDVRPPISSPSRRPLVIHGAGDVNLDPSYIPALRAQGYDHALSGLDGLFERDSLTVVNLECVPSDRGRAQPRPFNFRCDPAALPALAAGGVDVVNLANNHAMDYGAEALVDGLGNVRSAGLVPVGAGATRAEAFEAAVVERGGWRIAVVGLGGVYLARDWLATEDRPGISDGLDLDAMTDAVRRASRRADLVIVTIHWCCELQTTPNARNRAHADALVAAGADVILGHHHHRLQPLEEVAGAAVFWGLGNFVWPRFSVAGSTTAVGRVQVSPRGEIEACLLPAMIVSNGHPVLDGDTPGQLDEERRC
jgi:poly-gamma-glutamate synthesis protein (capsule biosynthesis protein)